MTPDQREDLEERIALIWDGTLTREPITWAEAEQIARQQRQDQDRLPLGNTSERLNQ